MPASERSGPTCLVVNAGSSTIKLSLLDGAETTLATELVELDGGDRAAERALDAAWGDWERPDAVGHRVVHGGDTFTGPVRIDGAVRDRLAELVDLAPLHQPAALEGIDLIGRRLPEVPAFACFDTAFHATLPSAAATYALPEPWRRHRRYGFHGLSHAYATRRAAELTGSGSPPRRLVSCHLGAGASLAAVLDGRCVDTTMGFTPLEGLVMATRSGSVDPGLLLWLQRREGMDAAELDRALNHRSGLLGLAGTADMREVLDRAAAGDERAELALEVYLHRLRAAIAAMTASLGGLDALVFTAGVGERSAPVRERAAAGLGYLGVEIDPVRNASARPDTEIGVPTASARCLVIAAREDLQIAGEVRSTLEPSI